jgi:hypothetical protein
VRRHARAQDLDHGGLRLAVDGGDVVVSRLDLDRQSVAVGETPSKDRASRLRRFDGDATRMYLRADRRVTTPAQLRSQVAYCNTELGAGYFPEDEEHVAAYLNLQFYQFKP